MSNAAARTDKKDKASQNAAFKNSDWKDFPTTFPSGQGNSMAWRQGFPKRRLQNSETAGPLELYSLDIQAHLLRRYRKAPKNIPGFAFLVIFYFGPYSLVPFEGYFLFFLGFLSKSKHPKIPS